MHNKPHIMSHTHRFIDRQTDRQTDQYIYLTKTIIR